MLHINPFVISSVTEQARYRQMAEYAVWCARLRALGIDAQIAQAYDERARYVAMTTPYRNSDVVAYCRQIALDALLRGDPMPATPEQAVEAENARALSRLFA